MRMSSFHMALFVSLAITNWTQGQGAGAVVSVQMKKRATFNGNLPLTSTCYNSEIENTSPLYCASQCHIRPEFCHGILFNRESGTCKFCGCNLWRTVQPWQVGSTLDRKSYTIIFIYKYQLSLSVSLNISVSFSLRFLNVASEVKGCDDVKSQRN